MRATQKKLYIERGKNTLQDQMTVCIINQAETFYEIAERFWEQNTEKGLRSRADFLLSLYFVSRSQLQRCLDLPSLGHRIYEREGPYGAECLFVVFYGSKTNQFGYDEVSGLFRHRDVAKCGVGSLAFYLFSRFEVIISNLDFKRKIAEFQDSRSSARRRTYSL